MSSLGLLHAFELPEHIERVVDRRTMLAYDPKTCKVLDYEGGFSVFAVDMDEVAALAMKNADSLKGVADAIGYVDEIFPLGEYEDALCRLGAFDVPDSSGYVYCAKIASDGSFDIVFSRMEELKS